MSYQTLDAGVSRSRGAELELEWSPRSIADLTVRGLLNYNDAKYRDFQGPCWVGQSAAASCNLSGPGGTLFQDLNGKRLFNAPRWTGSLGISYETGVSNGLRLGANADTRYSSSYTASVFDNPFAAQPHYVNVDAGVRLKAANDRWEMAIIGKNLTNRFVVNGVIDALTTGSGTGTAIGVPASQVGFVGFPRTVQVQATFHY